MVNVDPGLVLLASVMRTVAGLEAGYKEAQSDEAREVILRTAMKLTAVATIAFRDKAVDLAVAAGISDAFVYLMNAQGALYDKQGVEW